MKIPQPRMRPRGIFNLENYRWYRRYWGGTWNHFVDKRNYQWWALEPMDWDEEVGRLIGIEDYTVNAIHIPSYSDEPVNI